ncbi:hypothetical protein LSTR_LSTR010241 [Laodelphax striatellus]|uniref:DNA polymerase eta n=1 Tax=Laodelphax striatellus TaxID=195883 RepID=A0A482WL41_LAOST|nr:hypothetical protein LSTR_LSTR010241 [Laodelphax striatellus]
MTDRVIALIDMDCFYCQVEVRLNASLKDKPLAVVQYNTWKGGGIIAVNYEARDRGVTRHMRGNEAKSHCPEIELVHVPSVRGKADLTKYREAGREVAAVLCENCKCVERASIDEAYLDLTEEVNALLLKDQFVSEFQLANTFIVGYSQQNNNEECERSEGVCRWLSDLRNGELDDVASKKLAFGARIVEEIRASVYEKTGFRCSAGIAHNKIMAKLVCGLHKPNRQTVLPTSGVAELFSSLPVQKVRNLGGKFGSTVIDTLGCKVMADLARFSERELQSHFDGTPMILVIRIVRTTALTWLYNIARGIDSEPVTSKLMSKSIGCCKRFPGRNALRTRPDVMHWLNELSSEIADRLDEDYNLHKRRAHLLTASVQQTIDRKKVAMSKSSPISAYDAESIMQVALAAIKKTNNAPSTSNTWQPPLEFLGLSVGKFVDESSSANKTINHFFKTATTEKCASSSNIKTKIDTESEELNHKGDSSSSAAVFKSHQEIGEENSKNSIVSKSSIFFKSIVNSKGSSSSREINLKEVINERTSKENLHFDSSISVENSDDVDNEAGNVSNQLLPKVKETDSDCDMFDDTESVTGKLNERSKTETNSDNNKTVIACNDRVLGDSTKGEERPNGLVETENDLAQMENGEEISWISPREVFPDIDNLDDSLVQLMPSPFVKKLTSYKNEMDRSKSESRRNMFDSNESHESNPGPSTSSVVYDEHKRLGVENLKSSSSHDVANESDSYQGTEVSPDVFMDNEIAASDSSLVRNEISDSENEISERCPHCGESVRLSEFPEHLDHHVALDLHKSLNSSEVSQEPKKRILNSTENKPPKKKRGRPSSRESMTEKPTKSILSFFSKK